ncbi:MAG TPA: SRPBCC domain-containing protein [Planctomycetota bacterium]|nr:SRPBCC domain-containing protein [Planctomycetota bacterium]
MRLAEVHDSRGVPDAELSRWIDELLLVQRESLASLVLVDEKRLPRARRRGARGSKPHRSVLSASLPRTGRSCPGSLASPIVGTPVGSRSPRRKSPLRRLRIVEVDEFESTDPAMRGEMTITLELVDVDGGTDLLAVHEGLPRGLSPTDNENGWRLALDKLAALVEAG